MRALKVLVTGGAGFVGSHVVDTLLAGGHHVFVVDDLSTGHREFVHPAARFHRSDIRNRRLTGILSRIAPQAVVHAAAQASVARSLADPLRDADVNILGTINVLQAAHRAGARAFVYVSTGGAAYGDTSVVPTPEDHATRPTSFYGASKVSAERYVECFGSLAQMRTFTLRLANVYGPRQDPLGEAGVVAIFTARLLRGVPCVVTGDGEQTRDFVYVGDVADAVRRAVERDDAAGAVNISTGIETSINALYERLARLMGAQRKAKHAAARPGEQRRSALAPARAHAILGWRAETALDAGLGLTAEYFRQSARGRRAPRARGR